MITSADTAVRDLRGWASAVAFCEVKPAVKIFTCQRGEKALVEIKGVLKVRLDVAETTTHRHS